ncbi:hypothetical protein R8871_03105 [Paraburkholderia graminis C4D1M]|uniref:Cytochrome c oxidase subunit III n=1 Tax=Paraburkholderia graminis (strain ATCC 700544 / DSM 17151 / LMG 18924 / NCIMB 13744 / C4D1M) TaxID=396598 RepID=B1FXS0_PARG4|nr:cytochrome c oxidase subunit 3 [Paraburkholderia graminis]EDT11246.1 cytochrome c oxidase subunit III [Paraburkholderia graminis C4D1M]CAB3692428.1 hypothetical protein R8871_03105 [Paraburkholderia graminis C4D1M]
MTTVDERYADSRPRAARKAIHVGELPTYGFSHRSLMWWGTMGLMVIEGTVFAIAVMMYFYLRTLASVWPMNAPGPGLLWGSVNTAILVVSMLPNHLAKRAAEREDRAASRLWLLVCLAFSLAFLGVRALEFKALNVTWYDNAYGSVLWMLMGLHTVHLITDTFDTAVLDVLLFTGPVEGKRYVDVSENAAYWYFVVLSWLPIYAVVYWAPRL